MKRNLKALFIRIPCVLSITACSTAVLAQTNDELVLQYINDVCSRAAPNTPLEQACLATQGPGPHVGNAGSIGALGTTSAGVAYLSQRATERKEKKEQQEEKKKPSGGGASADFQLGKLGVFANLAYMDGTRDTTVKENGFDITQYGLTAGSDGPSGFRIFGFTRGGAQYQQIRKHVKQQRRQSGFQELFFNNIRQLFLKRQSGCRRLCERGDIFL